jgi:hypothetical protein
MNYAVPNYAYVLSTLLTAVEAVIDVIPEINDRSSSILVKQRYEYFVFLGTIVFRKHWQLLLKRLFLGIVVN